MQAVEDSDLEETEAPPSQESDSATSSTEDEQDDGDEQDEEEDEEDEEEDADNEDDEDDEEAPEAPSFKIPSRTIAAVEHPFLVMDVDKGVETFGPNPQFQSVSYVCCVASL